MKYKVTWLLENSQSGIFNYSNNGIELDNDISFLLSRGAKPEQIKIEVLTNDN